MSRVARLGDFSYRYILGDFILWVYFWKLQKSSKFFGPLLSTIKVMQTAWPKNGLRYILGDLFKKNHPVTLFMNSRLWLIFHEKLSWCQMTSKWHLRTYILPPKCIPKQIYIQHCQSWRVNSLFQDLYWQAGWPDWANFRPICNCYFWSGLKKIQNSPPFWATFFHGKSYV
jgi:hypothetical protein